MSGILSYALKLDTAAFTGPLGAATGAMRGLAGAAASTAGMIAKIAAPLAALGGGISVFKALEKAADMESLKVSFETILGSGQAADDMLRKITATAAATPYGIEELAQASRRLLAVTGRDELIPKLRMIGDVASAAQQPIGDLAALYAKFIGMDKIQGEAFEQLSIALPGSLQELAKIVGAKDIPALQKLGEEGRITGAALDQLFINMTSAGGKAFGAMDKQSQTTKGLLSTLTDAVSGLMVAIGTPINDFLKPIIAANTTRLETLTLRLKAFLALLKGAGEQGKLGEFIGASLNLALIDAINAFHAGIKGTVAYLAAAVPIVFKEAVDILTSDRTKLFFTGLFSGIGDLIASKMQKVISLFLLHIGNVPGAKNMASMAMSSKQQSELGFGTAKAALAGADFEGTVMKVAKALKTADAAGRKAFTDATASPYAPRGDAFSKWLRSANDINPLATEQFLNPRAAKADPADSKPVVAKGPVLRDKEDAAAKASAEKTRTQSLAAWAQETKLLEARATGRRRVIALAEKEAAIEKYKLELMDKQGLDADAAITEAQRRVHLEERAANPHKGKSVLDAAASTANRLFRQNQMNLKKNKDGDFINPAAAARALARGAAAADPNRARRDAAAAAAAAAKKAQDAQGKNVADIRDFLFKMVALA